MMILGKKIGMTQVFDDDGKLLPVTVIQAGPCDIMQVKTVDTDGYSAVQMGYDDTKPSQTTKPELGHAVKSGVKPKRFVKEMRLSEDTEEYEAGSQITVSAFNDVNIVDVVGTSKGKGFAGVMKLHGFGGFPASHGTERKHRAAGAISSFASDAGHGGNLKKGKRMAGRMGSNRVTSKSHKVVSIDEGKNLMVIKGSVPGPNGGYVIVKTGQKN
jgi:large subunit ribosomal protein L3